MNTMKRLTAIRPAPVATITVAVMTVLVLTGCGPDGPASRDSAQAVDRVAGSNGGPPPKSEPPPRESGVPEDSSGPGTPNQPTTPPPTAVPTQPAAPTQSGAPAGSDAGGNVHENAPTQNLGRLATALRLKHRSVNGVLLVPAGLNLTNAVEISVLWDVRGLRPTRVTQDYNNATGNRALFVFPEGDGTARPVQSDITLAEKAANGEPVAVYTVKSTVTFQPLYDIKISPMVIELLTDCDLVGESEVRLDWAGPDGRHTTARVDMDGGSTFTLPEFARTFTEVGPSADLTKPVIIFREVDPSPASFFAPAHKGNRPLLPGHDYAVDTVIFDSGDPNCGLWIKYSVTYALREYPFLD